MGIVALAENRPEDAVIRFREADQGSCPICILPFLAMAYDRAGETDSVLAIYERYVETPWLLRILIDGFFLPRIYSRLGEIYEERGDTENALEYYSRFIDLWEGADAELQPRVNEARVRMDNLAGEQ